MKLKILIVYLLALVGFNPMDAQTQKSPKYEYRGDAEKRGQEDGDWIIEEGNDSLKLNEIDSLNNKKLLGEKEFNLQQYEALKNRLSLLFNTNHVLFFSDDLNKKVFAQLSQLKDDNYLALIFISDLKDELKSEILWIKSDTLGEHNLNFITLDSFYALETRLDSVDGFDFFMGEELAMIKEDYVWNEDAVGMGLWQNRMMPQIKKHLEVDSGSRFIPEWLDKIFRNSARYLLIADILLIILLTGFIMYMFVKRGDNWKLKKTTYTMAIILGLLLPFFLVTWLYYDVNLPYFGVGSKPNVDVTMFFLIKLFALSIIVGAFLTWLIAKAYLYKLKIP